MRGHHLFAEHTAHSPFGSIACNDFTCRSGQGTRQHLMRVFVLTDDPDAILANRAEPVHVRAIAIRFRSTGIRPQERLFARMPVGKGDASKASRRSAFLRRAQSFPTWRWRLPKIADDEGARTVRLRARNRCKENERSDQKHQTGGRALPATTTLGHARHQAPSSLRHDH